MEYVRLGKTGVLVSQVSLGTMTFGKEADEMASHEIMDYAFDQGINFFDCANNYNKGLTEEIVGRWIAPRRGEVILTSKVFFPAGGGMNDEGLSFRNILRSVEGSLKRLQTDYLDVLYLHHWDANVPIEQSLAAMAQLVSQGKVLYCGVSNFAAWQAMKAIATAEKQGFPPIACLQPMYCLLKRQVEVELLPLAADQGLAVMPYNVLGAGMLTGKYTDPTTKGRINEVDMYRRRYTGDQYAWVTERFVAYAKERDLPPAALAAAWVLSHPQVTSPIIGARNLQQLKDTLQCLDHPLDSTARAEITALSIDPPLATDREA